MHRPGTYHVKYDDETGQHENKKGENKQEHKAKTLQFNDTKPFSFLFWLDIQQNKRRLKSGLNVEIRLQ